MKELWIIAAVALIVGAAVFIKEKEKRVLNRQVIHVDNRERIVETNESFSGRCEAKRIFNDHQWHEFKRLKRMCDKRYLVICPKVRLLEIVEPKSNDPKRQILLNKLQSKYLDFVICDSNYHVLGVVQLDDLRFDEPDRKIQDKFVDDILNDVGYTVIHATYINDNTLDPILEKLDY